MRILLFIATVVSVFSCELVTEVKIPSIPPKLVVNSVYTTDSTWGAQISSSRHILGEIDPPKLDDIVVHISDDNGESFTMSELGFDSTAGRYYFSSRTHRSRAGRMYTMTVQAPGYETVFATSRAPQAVELVDVKVDSANMVPSSDFSRGSCPIEFTFRDLPGEGDFYYPEFYLIITANSYDSAGNINGTYESPVPYRLTRTIPNDTFTEFAEPDEVVLDDKEVDGTLRTVRLHASVGFYGFSGTEPHKWKFAMTHTYVDYYKYFRSVELQRNTQGNPFAQPVQIYTNMEGGLGIFTGLAASEWNR